MTNFLHSPLTWAFLLVAVPLLIHLINMMRHKRVKWAAMEFLLASYKKHRKWIWLKQLILLLMRMAAIAAVVAIMAQWVPPDRWAKLFGGKVTHHYVLVDDSFSMTDGTSGETAFSQAKEAIERLVERAAAEESQQKLTLIRYSAAAQSSETTGASVIADVSNQNIGDAKWREEFRAQSSNMEPSQLAAGPESAMKLLDRLLEEENDESRVVYVISDFRQRDWGNPTTIDQYLQAWEKAGTDVHLVDCVAEERPNLAVTKVTPTEGTRSAGVPLFVTVTVKNFGPTKAEDVELTVTSYAYPTFSPTLHGDNPATIKPEALDKRTVVIESLAAGESVSRRVQVRFPGAGQHVVEASLPQDAVEVDNAGYCVVDFPEGEPVLILDGHDENRNAYFLLSVFQPSTQDFSGGGRSTALTGIVPTIGDPVDLNSMPLEELQKKYRAVYLLDVPRLDEAAIKKLQAYVNGGGGLAIFLGDNVNPTHYTEQLYNEGEGLLPIPLDKLELLTLGDLEDEERVPDFEAVDHPVMEIFNLPIVGISSRRGMLIGTYYLPPSGWSPPVDDAVRVLATLRDKAKTPLAIEKRYGSGRVIVFNTTAAPIWNNWGGEASFPATMLLLHGYIAAPLRSNESRLVGAEVDTRWDASAYMEDAQFIIPEMSPTSRKPVAVKAKEVAVDDSVDDAEAKLLELKLGGPGDTLNSVATRKQGIYEIWAAKKTGALDLEVDRFAFNVDAEEGDLARVTSRELADKLGAEFSYHGVGEGQYQTTAQAASPVSEVLLYVLIALLIGEQLLAYSASYHPAPTRSSPARNSQAPSAGGVAR